MPIFEQERDPNDATSPISEERIRDFDAQSPQPRPPRRFIAEDTGSGVRCTVVNDGPMGRLNGTVRYDVYWAEDVDTTTYAGKAAGFARAVCLAPSIPATTVDNSQSSAFYADPKYASGYFFCVGVDKDGKRSRPTEPARVVTGPIDYTIPGDVRHFQVSESGKVSNGTVFSELSVTCEPPEDTANFGGVQLYLEDYLALGDVQEGYFHRWYGSGGINFAALYPIPRRRSTVSVTCTNGSPNVIATGGLLAVAKAGEQFELLGVKSIILAVTDTQITLTDNWPKANVTSADYVIIAKPTIYGVAVSKAGTRAELDDDTPQVAVLMDGEISVPNAPSGVTVTQIGAGVRIEWNQVEGSTISGYRVYRSDGASVDTGMASQPPVPAATTKYLGDIQQNQDAPSGYALMQFDDTNFTQYERETNAVFTWYVSTVNTRGDESAATDVSESCRAVVPGEVDPTLPTLSDPKNYLYDAMLSGTTGVLIAANDTAQDAFTGADASNLPGSPFGAASGQADGSGRLRGHTRWEATDGGLGAAGSVQFFGTDEISFDAPGSGKAWYVYQETGGWDHGTDVFRKIEKGGLYVVSGSLLRGGSANGTFHIYVEQMNDGVRSTLALLRVRGSDGTVTATADSFQLDCTQAASEETRYWACFQMDETATTKQVRVNYAWADGTTGFMSLKKPALTKGEFPAAWTPDMGDTSVSIPAAGSPTPPVGDGRRERIGDIFVIVPG